MGPDNRPPAGRNPLTPHRLPALGIGLIAHDLRDPDDDESDRPPCLAVITLGSLGAGRPG